MIKSLLFFLLFLPAFARVGAQVSDSLQTELQRLQAARPGGSIEEAVLLVRLGQSLHRQSKHDEAIARYGQALALQQLLLPAHHPDITTTEYLLGWAHLGRSTYNEAVDWLEKAAKGYLAHGGEETVEYANVLEKLTQAYLYNGRYTDALANAQLLLTLRKKLHPPRHPAIAKACIVVGTQYKYLKKYADALVYFQDALDIYLLAEQKNHNAIAECYSEIGQIYLYQKDYPRALSTFLLEDSTMIGGGENLRYDYAYTCTDLGKYYLATGNYPEALRWQQKAMDIALAYSRSDNTNLATFHLYLGRAQSAMGQFAQAIASFEANAGMLERLYGAHSSRQYHNNAELGYACLRWYRQNRDTTLLQKSRSFFRTFESDIADLMRVEILPDAQQKLRNESLGYFERAILAELEALQLQPDNPEILENAWRFSEKMHSFMLFSATIESRARHFSGIPDTLLDQDKSLQSSLATLGKRRLQWIQNLKNQASDSAILALDLRIAQLKAEQTRLRRELEQEYPAYHQLKYQTQLATLAQIQQNLGPEQTLLEYFVGDSTLFLFEVSRTNCTIHRIPIQDDLPALTEAYQLGITAYHTAANKSARLYRESVLQYEQAAVKLYELLWRPVASRVGEEVLLIPGESLNGIPFEALLSAQPLYPGSFSGYPFLLKKHHFQYAYSATMYLEMQNRQHPDSPRKALLAMAPYCCPDMAGPDTPATQRASALPDDLTPLPYSDEEVMAVARCFGDASKTALGKDADKALFYLLASQYRILHLATHGKANGADGNQCYLALARDPEHPEAGLITAAELYNLPIPADLVVLSACETGIGEHLRGEGMVSLARAFAYAGAKSIVASLWSVNDQSTMHIMDAFYEGLKAGKPKNMALGEAKRGYLQKYAGQQSHPFFWAGFIGLGDSAPIH